MNSSHGMSQLYGSRLLRHEQASVPVSTHILYWLSFSDLIASVQFFYAGITDAIGRSIDCPASRALACNGPPCQLFAASLQFFFLAAVFWTGSLAVNLQRSVLDSVYSLLGNDTQFMRGLHVAIWGM